MSGLFCGTVKDSTLFRPVDVGWLRLTSREIRFERVPVIIVVTTLLLFTCFAQMNWIPIGKAAIRSKETNPMLNEE
jgi:hypothetical protein